MTIQTVAPKAAAPTTFTIHSHPRGGAPTRIEVSGPLAGAANNGFRVLLGDLVADPAVVIDLSACTHIDGVGVGALAGAAARIRGNGGTATLVGTSPALELALVAAGSASLLPPRSARRCVSVTMR